MATSEQDDAQKTEEPTPKKLKDARDKGQVARSQEVNHWFVILGFAIIVGLFGPAMVNEIGLALLPFLERPHLVDVTGETGRNLLLETLARVGAALVLPGLAMMVLVIAAGLLQVGVLFTLEPTKPKLSKLSPISGFKRIFGTRALMEFAKGVLKITLVGGTIGLLLWPERHRLVGVPELSVRDVLELLQAEALKVLGGVLAVMAAVAGLDYLFQRHKQHKEMRMSRQEVKDEHKQAEGDPMVKARLRQIRQERARRRMMAAVPEADVVITNPTHFAVALKYDAESRGAPHVVAKGMDHLALKIREIAEAHDVPIVENRPLARALHESVDLDEEIPPEHYRAVAEVIGYVMRLRGRRATR